MELISAVTCSIRKTAKYIYSAEIREYKVTRYRIRYSPKSYLCTVFHTYEEAEHWARFNQPNYRPYYIIERSEHFEIVGEVI